MNPVFAKRFKSFLWRVMGMVAVAGVDFLAVNLELFNLSPEVVVVAGLVLGEVTKYYNKK